MEHVGGEGRVSHRETIATRKNEKMADTGANKVLSLSVVF